MAIEDFLPVRFKDDELMLLDQTKLPNEEEYFTVGTVDDLYDAIEKLKVRGAPAIGVAAGYGMYVAARCFCTRNEMMGSEVSKEEFELLEKALRDARDYLVSARPTAVNLKHAAFRVFDAFEDAYADRVRNDEEAFRTEAVLETILAEAEAIRREDEESCRAMGEYGLSLLDHGMGILTHCNAGVLATAGYGTALAPLHMGQERGYDFRVFSDETRPLLQGARLTSWELMKSGVDVTLICDNMASLVMSRGLIDAIVVGCDRMAANGDGANKIGTSALAILAKEYGIPFYMFVPTSTIDMETKTGEDIVIEERRGDEIYRMWYERPMAPEGIKTFNPAFDVTKNEYITAVVTDRGIVRAPFDRGLAELMGGTDVQG